MELLNDERYKDEFCEMLSPTKLNKADSNETTDSPGALHKQMNARYLHQLEKLHAQDYVPKNKDITKEDYESQYNEFFMNQNVKKSRKTGAWKSFTRQYGKSLANIGDLVESDDDVAEEMVDPFAVD